MDMGNGEMNHMPVKSLYLRFVLSLSEAVSISI